MNNEFQKTDSYRALEKRYRLLKEELAELGWLTDGSVTPNNPGYWRWTRKVNGKTVTVSLSEAQSNLFRSAIANHRRLEAILREMRAISQEVLLNSAESVRKKPRMKSPKSALS
jgi:hypothetical protein